MFIKEVRVNNFMSVAKTKLVLAKRPTCVMISGTVRKETFNFLHAIAFVLDPGNICVPMSTVRAKTSKDSYVKLLIGLDADEQMYLSKAGNFTVGAQLIVTRYADEKRKDHVFVNDPGTQVLLDDFHRVLYGNMAYSMRILDLNDIQKWFFRYVGYTPNDAYLAWQAVVQQKRLAHMEHRQSCINEMGQVVTERAILNYLIQRHAISTDRHTSERTNNELARLVHLSSAGASVDRLKRHQLSAALHANQSEHLHGVYLAMQAFVKMPTHRDANNSEHMETEYYENRVASMKTLLLRSKEMYALEKEDTSQQIDILRYKSSQVKDQFKAKEMQNLQEFIAFNQNANERNASKASAIKKNIENLQLNVTRFEESIAFAQMRFENLDEAMLLSLNQCLRLQIEKRTLASQRNRGLLKKLAAFNDIMCIHLGGVARQLFRKEVIAGNIAFESVILDADEDIFEDYRGQVVDFLQLKNEYAALVPFILHGLSSALTIFIFGTSRQMQRMRTLMQSPFVNHGDIFYELGNEECFRKRNVSQSIHDVAPPYCRPISDYFEPIENTMVMELLDDFVVLIDETIDCDVAELAQSVQRNVLCVRTHRIYYYNGTIQAIGELQMDCGEYDLFAERLQLRMARLRARRNAVDLLKLNDALKVKNQTLTTLTKPLKKAQAKLVKHRIGMQRLRWKLYWLNEKVFGLTKLLVQNQKMIQLDGFRHIHLEFVDGFDDPIQLKAAAHKALRQLQIIKTKILTKEVDMQSLSSEIETCHIALINLNQARKITSVTEQFRMAWNDHVTEMCQQKTAQNVELIDMYTANFATLRARQMAELTEANNAWQAAEKQSATIEQCRKSLAERFKPTKGYAKAHKEMANHPMVRERAEWTVDRLKARLTELESCAPRHKLSAMHTRFAEQMNGLKFDAVKALAVIKSIAQIDKLLVERIAYSHLQSLRTLITMANRWIPSLYQVAERSMRLYMVLRNGDRLSTADDVYTVELRDPSSIVSFEFLLYDGPKLVDTDGRIDGKLMALSIYLAACVVERIRPIILLDDMSKFSVVEQNRILGVLQSEPLLGSQQFCVTNAELNLTAFPNVLKIKF